MAEPHTIETYGHTIARRRSFVTPGRFFCPSSCSLPTTHYHVITVPFTEAVMRTLLSRCLKGMNAYSSLGSSLACVRFAILLFRYNIGHFTGLSPGGLFIRRLLRIQVRIGPHVLICNKLLPVRRHTLSMK